MAPPVGSHGGGRAKPGRPLVAGHPASGIPADILRRAECLPADHELPEIGRPGADQSTDSGEFRLLADETDLSLGHTAQLLDQRDDGGSGGAVGLPAGLLSGAYG